MEIVTGALRPDQVLAEVDHISGFLRQHSMNEFVASYGWACNLEIDELWKDISLQAGDLPSFIARSIGDGIYKLGESDFFVGDVGRRCKFQLCHEADIHFATNDRVLFESLRSQWLSRGYNCTQLSRPSSDYAAD